MKRTPKTDMARQKPMPGRALGPGRWGALGRAVACAGRERGVRRKQWPGEQPRAPFSARPPARATPTPRPPAPDHPRFARTRRSAHRALRAAGALRREQGRGERVVPRLPAAGGGRVGAVVCGVRERAVGTAQTAAIARQRPCRRHQPLARLTTHTPNPPMARAPAGAAAAATAPPAAHLPPPDDDEFGDASASDAGSGSDGEDSGPRLDDGGSSDDGEVGGGGGKASRRPAGPPPGAPGDKGAALARAFAKIMDRPAPEGAKAVLSVRVGG